MSAGAQSEGYDYDLFVIGGGTGGVRAARMSAQFGRSPAVLCATMCGLYKAASLQA